MNPHRWRFAALATLALLATAPAASAGPPTLLDSLLMGEGAFKAEERARLQQGHAVAKVLDTDDRSEVFAVAGLRVQAGADAFLALLRDGRGLRLASDAIQAGRFSTEPHAEDLAGDVLDSRELGYLKSCRPAACKVRLGAEAMERFRHEVDWRSPRSAEHATALWHELLAGYAASYLARGNAALAVYADDDPPVRVADGVQRLLGRFRWLEENVPELHDHLSGFPRTAAGVEGALYWLKERFWIKPVLSVNYLCWVSRPRPGERLVVAAEKQLYANHYFESSIRLLLLVEEDTANGPVSTLVLLSRSRADVPASGFSWLERALMRRLVKGRLERQLRWLEGQLDAHQRSLALARTGR